MKNRLKHDDGPALRFGAVALLLVVSLLPAHAIADPIRVSGGMYVHYSGDDFPDQSLTAGFLFFAPFVEGFSPLSMEMRADQPGSVQVVGSNPPGVPRAGAPWNLSNRVTWTSAQLMKYTSCNEEDCYDGMAYRSAGTFIMTAGPALLVAPFTDHPALLTAFAPFTFTGFFEAFIPGTRTLAFRRRIEGRGEAQFSNLFSQRGFFYGYDFEAALFDAPVPEPATLLLLVGGLGSLGIRRRWRTRRSGARPR